MNSGKSPLKSPMKSPLKKSRKVNDENCSPTKQIDLFSSPEKKSPTKDHNDRKTQRRNTIEVEQVDTPTKSSDQNKEQEMENKHLSPGTLGTSPLKSCRKSPLKRMRKLEEEDIL